VQPARRHLKVRVEIANRGAAERRLVYALHGPVAIDTESIQAEGNDIHLGYGFWGRRGDVHAGVLSAADLSGGRWERTDRMAWVGISNNYFTSILFPLEGQAGAAPQSAGHVEKAFGESFPDPRKVDALAQAEQGKPAAQLAPDAVSALAAKAYKNLRVGLRSTKLLIKPGETVAHEYGLYLGPRSPEALAPYDALNFRGVNHYGLFTIIIKFFIWLLGLLKVIAFGSWGLAIILLTVIVKACLHPINRKSQAGMMRFQKQMQKIKPEMDELKTRYGDNRMKMNQEMQKLWKAHGINPAQQMAGCLLIFCQLPIWYGLYSTLQYALGLRQASFLWMKDLTRPDMLVHWGASLPFLGEWLNVLPIAYVILTVINQRLQPKPTDPQMLAQYRMMSFMLVFFGFIFYKFPSGFMLYIMTSAGLGIIESKIIKRELARDDTAGPEPLPQAAYPGRPKKPDRDAGARVPPRSLPPWRKGKR
jgi:YidC/Oxa1 family membrane protein insertase